MQSVNCRVCTENSTQFKNIFESEDNKTNFLDIAALIKQHLDFQLDPDDTSSSVVCFICWEKLLDFHDFYIKVNEAQKLYHVAAENRLSTTTDLPEIEINLNEIKSEPLLEAQDLVDKQAIRCEESQIETLNPLCLWKVDTADDENEFLDCDQVETLFDIEPENISVTSKRKTKNRKSGKLSGKRLKGTKTAERARKNVASPKVRQQQKDTSYTPEDEALIRKHILFSCGECGVLVSDFTTLKEHFVERHGAILAYIRCCGRKYTSRRRQHLLQHARRHENPEHFKCAQCQKVLVDDYSLQAHIRSDHPKEGDLKFKCEECDKRFARRQQLEIHQITHIPEDKREFFCEKCPASKGFASLRQLQMHDFRVHKRARNVCHFCAKVISDQVYFERHVRQHTDPNAPRVKCPRPNCDSWLKDRCCLKEHIKHVHRDEGKIFTCDVCNKTCANRRALKSHQSYAHSNTTFTCGECSKTFKKAISLKEHMAQHTGETLYKCPFCDRTFNSNANMHAHKKKMHPIEWDLWRKTKKGSSQQIITKQLHTLNHQIDGASNNNLATIP